MIELLLVFAFMLLLLAGMAVGVLMGREPIRGTCGGLSAMGADGSCDLCGGNPAACDGDGEPTPATPGRNSLGSDAMAEPARL